MPLPSWTVQYLSRRPTLTRPITTADHAEIEVGALDRAGAEAAFKQGFPASHKILAIILKSATGPA